MWKSFAMRMSELKKWGCRKLLRAKNGTRVEPPAPITPVKVPELLGRFPLTEGLNGNPEERTKTGESVQPERIYFAALLLLFEKASGCQMAEPTSLWRTSKFEFP